MRTKPSLSYSGLTIIIDEPSRFDIEFQRLLSGAAGDWLNRECLPPPYCVESSDIRDCDCELPLSPGTKAVLLLGESAAKKFGRVSCDPPGYSTIVHGIPAISAFYPQDCCDFRNMRAGNVDYDEDAVTDRDAKERVPTRAKSRRYWTAWHIRKFLSIKPKLYPKLNERLYPRLDEAISCLEKVKEGEDLYLDIETSRIHSCLSCIGFSAAASFPTVFVVPVYLISGDLAYKDFHRFYKALSLAISRSNIVIHNAMFDLLVLHGFYHMCLPFSVFDTMVAQHRISPETEKSLAHVISAWTNEPNHKDFNTDVYSHDGEQALWRYNARDVYTLRLIKDAQLAYAANDPGLAASIAQGNASIIPYLSTSLTGMRLDTMRLASAQLKLLRFKELYARIASILTGKPFNPASSKQCSDFFHKTLNYPVISRTAKGGNALGSKQLYQLQLAHNNPLIPVILKYREVAKDASSLESELFNLS